MRSRIIITAYLPIFTLQSVEGRLFKPMAWTVAFALLGALIFSMILAPVMSSFLFSKGTKEWENPVLRRGSRSVTAVSRHLGYRPPHCADRRGAVPLLGAGRSSWPSAAR